MPHKHRDPPIYLFIFIFWFIFYFFFHFFFGGKERLNCNNPPRTRPTFNIMTYCQNKISIMNRTRKPDFTFKFKGNYILKNHNYIQGLLPAANQVSCFCMHLYSVEIINDFGTPGAHVLIIAFTLITVSWIICDIFMPSSLTTGICLVKLMNHQIY